MEKAMAAFDSSVSDGLIEAEVGPPPGGDASDDQIPWEKIVEQSEADRLAGRVLTREEMRRRAATTLDRLRRGPQARETE